jgi:hypothetical protein
MNAVSFNRVLLQFVHCFSLPIFRFVPLAFSCVILVLSGLFTPTILRAQWGNWRSLPLVVNISKQTPSITLSWAEKPDTITKYSAFIVYKKGRSDVDFLPITDSLPITTTTYTDTDVEVGVGYEYQVVGFFKIPNGESYLSIGYTYSGIELPSKANRGNVLLVVDNTMDTPLTDELSTLTNDLNSEGFRVSKILVPRADSSNSESVNLQLVRTTKDSIRNWYNDVKKSGGRFAVLLIGRVAVPYSGMFDVNGKPQTPPDAHVPDHRGAWAADTYYADMGADSLWTDKFTDTAATRSQNKNVAGDGKFDNELLPQDLVLQVGRIDMYDLPYFLTNSVSLTETDLLRRYLQKNHSYRSGEMPITMKAVIQDNFGLVEGFSRSAYMTFPTLVGADNVETTTSYSNAITKKSYIWSYGAGPGGYTGAGGIINSVDIPKANINSVFTMLFGSYFGDYDSRNNLLRTMIASAPSALTCAWSGRPVWYFHTMGLGETTGDATLISQNNISTYSQSAFYYGPHVVLIGDPTLRMRYRTIQPPQNVSVQQVAVPSRYVEIKWEYPSSGIDSIAGFRVYKTFRQSNGNEITRELTKSPIKELIYRDSTLLEGNITYSIRTEALVNSPSGSFFDVSNKASQTARITSVENNDFHSATQDIMLYPQPADNSVSLRFSTSFEQRVEISVCDLQGNTVAELSNRILGAGEHVISWSILNKYNQYLPSGVYLVRVIRGTDVATKKLIVR